MNTHTHSHWCPMCEKDVPCAAAASGGCIFSATSPLTCEPCSEALVREPEPDESWSFEDSHAETERTWSRYDIWSRGGPPDRPVVVECASNDDDDDGHPDADSTHYTLHFRTVEDALKQFGHSRVGFSGCEVTVRLDGVRVEAPGRGALATAPTSPETTQRDLGDENDTTPPSGSDSPPAPVPPA